MICFLGFLLGTVAAVVGLAWAYPGALGTEDSHIDLAYALMLLIMLYSCVVIASRTHHLHNHVKTGLASAAIILAGLVVYTYQDGFKVLTAEMIEVLDPAAPQQEEGAVRIRASSDGHFQALAEVNGIRVRFLIDTGASEVVLTKQDAKRLGIEVRDLDYILPVATANGVMYVAPVRLKSIKLGSIEVRGINAQVAGEGLANSLLGMSYLRRLKSYEFSRQELVLKE